MLSLILFSLLNLVMAKDLAITFDDLPLVAADERNAIDLVDHFIKTINDKKITVSGFVVGKSVHEINQGAKILEKLAANKIELYNHSFTHEHFTKLNGDDLYQEVLKTEEILLPLSLKYGPFENFFRFPFLDYSRDIKKFKELHQKLKLKNIKLAPVSIDTSDWAFARFYYNHHLILKNDKNKLKQFLNFYLTHLKDCISQTEMFTFKLFKKNIPQIILLHFNMLNLEYIDQVINLLDSKNYKSVKLSEVMKQLPYNELTDEHYMFESDSVMSKLIVEKKLGYNFDKDKSNYAYFVKYWEPKLKELLLK